MQTTIRKKLPLLVGLAVLSLVLLAAEAQVVQALVDAGTGAPVRATSVAAQGRGGVNGVLPSLAPGKGAVSSGTTSTASSTTTMWIVINAVVAGLAIITLAWALARRSREVRPDEARRTAFCALHPDDAICRTT